MAEDNELVIYLKLITSQADQADQAFHNSARQRIKQTAAEQEAADKSYIRAIKLKERAIQDFSKELERRGKEQDREQRNVDNAYVQAKKQQANAIASIDKENFRMWKAGADVQHKQAMQDWSNQQKAAKGVGSEILNIATAYTLLRIAAEVSQAAQAALQAMAHEAMRTRDFVKGVVDEMEALRTKTTEILAMRGQPVTGENATRMLMGAQETLRDPAEYIKSRQTALQYTQRFITTPQQGDQEDRMFRWSQKMTAGLGIAGEDVARLHDATMAVSRDKEGNVIEGDYKKNFAGFLRQSQKAFGATSTFLPQASTYLAVHARQGDTKEMLMEGVAKVQIEAEVHGAASANVYAESLERGLRKIRTDKHGLMDEVGMTYEMKDNEAALKVKDYVSKKAKEELGAGASEHALRTKEDDILFGMTGEQRSFRAMAKFIEAGAVQGGFERSVKDAMAASPEELEKNQAKFALGVEGKKKFEVAKSAVQRSSIGTKYEQLRDLERRAYNVELSKGTFEDTQNLGAALGTTALAEAGFGKYEEQAIRARMSVMLRSEVPQKTLKEFDEAQGFRIGDIPGHIAGALMSVFSPFGAQADSSKRLQRGRAALGMTAGAGQAIDQFSSPRDLADLIEEGNRERARQTKVIEQPFVNPPAHIPVAPFGGAASPRFGN